MYTQNDTHPIVHAQDTIILPCQFLCVDDARHMLGYTSTLKRSIFESAHIDERCCRINIMDKEGRRIASVSFESLEEAKHMFKKLLRSLNNNYQSSTQYQDEGTEDKDR